MTTTSTYYISIGNSDDKLTQDRWATFVVAVDAAVSSASGARLHGDWYSSPLSPWQNACWCIEINEERHPDSVARLKRQLVALAARFEQTSIAWARACEVEFIGAPEGVPA